MAAAEQIRFPTEAVRQHAETVDGVGAAVREARAAVTEVTMDTQAYGVLCQFLPTILSPVFQAAVDALNSSDEALRETALGLRDTADTVRATDDASAASIGGVR